MSAFTRAGENGRLTVAVPAKGRMAEPALRLLADAGLSFETTERSLVVPCANAPVDLLLVRPSDIPEYVQDGVVDLVSTGSTASANGLRLIGTLLSSQAVLVGGRAAVDARHELVERLELMLSGVVAARRRRYVMMNATTETLPAIREVLPSMGAPTVLELADEGAIAVHAAVAADDVWALLPALRDAGATSILVLPIERLVP